MKHKLLNSMLVALSFVTFHVAAMAQSDLHVRANVPFGFTIENKTFAPGTYDITQLEPSILTLKGSAGSVVVRVRDARREVSATANPGLVFHRYGMKYFLAQISQAQGELAMAVPVGNQEQELARAKTSRDLVAVAAVGSRAGK